MTVGELIEHLKECDRDAPVVISQRGSYITSYRDAMTPSSIEVSEPLPLSGIYHVGEETAYEI